MPFAWTARQFVGGSLCLDLTNTVYYADDPDRRGDRLASAADIAGWLAAAERFAPEDSRTSPLAAPARSLDAPAVSAILSLRQAADDLFRAVARKAPLPAPAYRRMLFELGMAAGNAPLSAGPDGIRTETPEATATGVRAALAGSAVALAQSGLLDRLKACPNCHWLFVDRSRNASRVWCDMLTCGNRAKAQRHHRNRAQADV